MGMIVEIWNIWIVCEVSAAVILCITHRKWFCVFRRLRSRKLVQVLSGIAVFFCFFGYPAIHTLAGPIYATVPQAAFLSFIYLLTVFFAFVWVSKWWHE